MQKIERKRIDWKKTGIRLKNLRDHNPKLQRDTCWFHRERDGGCALACESCEFGMDRNVSRAELAAVLQTSESVIANWEGGRTVPEIEDILLIAEICEIAPEDILVLEK